MYGQIQLNQFQCQHQHQYRNWATVVPQSKEVLLSRVIERNPSNPKVIRKAGKIVKNKKGQRFQLVRNMVDIIRESVSPGKPFVIGVISQGIQTDPILKLQFELSGYQGRATARVCTITQKPTEANVVAIISRISYLSTPIYILTDCSASHQFIAKSLVKHFPLCCLPYF